MLQIVKEHSCQSVVDFGCGEGAWIKTLMLDPEQSKVVSVLGVDESPVALQRGSKLIPSVQLKCAQQEELQGKPLPSVKLCQVLHTHASVVPWPVSLAGDACMIQSVAAYSVTSCADRNTARGSICLLCRDLLQPVTC